MIWVYLALVYFVGAISGFMLHWWLGRRRSYSGIMHVVKHPDKTVFTLDVLEDPVLLLDKEEVIFKVKTSEENDDRS